MQEYKKPNILEFINEKMQEGYTEEEAGIFWDSLGFCEPVEREYVFSYKVKTIPFWYVWTCYAESAGEATNKFFKENMLGLETFKIVKVNNI